MPLAQNPTKPHHRLDQAQVDSYMDQGYLIYPDRIFPDEKFARLKRHFDAKLAALPGPVGYCPPARISPMLGSMKNQYHG